MRPRFTHGRVMTARIISVEELQDEDARRTVKCNPAYGGCGQWIRYIHDDREEEKRNESTYTFVRCPCGNKRTLGIR